MRVARILRSIRVRFGLASLWIGALGAAAWLAGCSGDGRPNGRLRRIAGPHPPREGIYARARTIGTLRLPGRARSLVLRGDVLYAFLNFRGLTTVDISDPARPRAVSHLPAVPPDDPLKHPYYFDGLPEGDRMVVIERTSGLTIMDISDPSRPRIQWSLGLKGLLPAYLTRVGGMYYLSAGGGGLFALPADFDQASRPRPVLTDFDHVKVSVALPPHHLLVADNHRGGMKVLDVSDPARPRLISQFIADSFCDAVELVGRTAVMQVRRTGLLFVNVDDPARPYLAGMFPTREQSMIKAMTRLGESRLLAGYNSGTIDVIDLTDPADALWLGRLLAPTGVMSLAARDDLIFVGLARQPSNDPDSTGYQLAILRLEEVARPKDEIPKRIPESEPDSESTLAGRSSR